MKSYSTENSNLRIDFPGRPIFIQLAPESVREEVCRVVEKEVCEEEEVEQEKLRQCQTVTQEECSDVERQVG